NGVKVLAQDNTLTIQVGANDGETIDIDLKQINSQTLGLDTLNVQKAYDVSATAAMDPKSFTDGTKSLTAPNATAIKAALGNPTTAGDSLSATLSFKDGKYYATVAGYTNAADTSKNGKYEVNVDSATGAVTFNAAPTKATVTGDKTVTKVQVNAPVAVSTDVKKALEDGGVSNADATAAKLVKMSYTDKNGKSIDGGYALEAGGKYYAATYDEGTGKITANVTTYTDSTGATKTAANQLGGVDGKTEVVTIDGKTYNASKAAGHDFKAQPELAEAAAKTTENPLAKIDAALAQVDALRSDLGAVQNRFNSAITNLGNTVNNLSEARSRIEDSDYATEVSNMSRAQILQQAGTSVLAQANQVPQNVLSLLR
ncbi:flagellin FliC, partial [Salmonella enterica subsp. enterica]|nr:flagellin FliC [Salmonella enterica subsp. enterica]